LNSVARPGARGARRFKEEGAIMRRITFFVTVLAVLIMATVPMLATTWAPEKKKCPVCEKKSEFMDIVSYGNYIYRWPTKYQYFFWPKTDANFLYCCPKCYYCAYMWDFESLPKDKAEVVRKALEGTTLKKVRHYDDMPMSVRLELAEKAYAVLDEPDNFWCDFYRIKGYWLEQEKKADEATLARKKALALAEKMCADPARATEMKALLYIAGSMSYFIEDKEGAMAYFKKALPMQYKQKEMTDEQNKNTDEFLDELLKDFIARLSKGEAIPRS
jgi:uncharacterized protein (DUF2225 family)